MFYLLSMVIEEKSILCLLLKVSSLDGMSKSERGPKGEHVAKRAS